MDKNKIFKDFDFNRFWEDTNEAIEEYQETKLNASLIATVEEKLGFKLPESYIELLSARNGGMPTKNCFPTSSPTSWADNHIQISGFLGIGMEKENSLCGEMGNELIIEEWGYPKLGVYICDCPSGGHDIIMLDYSECGANGEPRVIHVDQDLDYKITVLSNDFESFVHGLVHEESFI